MQEESTSALPFRKDENIKENKFKSNISKRFDNAINLIVLFFIYSVMIYQISPKDVNNKIVLQFKNTGIQQVLHSNFPFIPSHIYLNSIEVNFTDYRVELKYTTDKITLIWTYEYNNNTKNMFYGLYNIINIDLNDFNSDSIRDMMGMFHACTNLKNINFGNFNTKNVESMENLFCNCISLESLDLSSFDTSKVTSMSKMFYNCKKLNNIIFSEFKNTLTNDMSRYVCFL